MYLNDVTFVVSTLTPSHQDKQIFWVSFIEWKKVLFVLLFAMRLNIFNFVCGSDESILDKLSCGLWLFNYFLPLHHSIHRENKQQIDNENNHYSPSYCVTGLCACSCSNISIQALSSSQSALFVCLWPDYFTKPSHEMLVLSTGLKKNLWASSFSEFHGCLSEAVKVTRLWVIN